MEGAQESKTLPIKLEGFPDRYLVMEQFPSTDCSDLYAGIDLETNAGVFIKKSKLSDLYVRELLVFARLSLLGKADAAVPLLACFPNYGYLVMPFFGKGNLYAYRKQKQTKLFTLDETVSFISEIGLALEKLHGAGIVHNDLKETNVLLASNSKKDKPSIKLIDFGLSFFQSYPLDLDSGLNYLKPTSFSGTPGYMAPEKASVGSIVTHLADIFSLGAIAYVLMTRTRPYLNLENYGKPVPEHHNVPVPMLEFIRKACAADPARRFQSAREMVSALEIAVRKC